MSARTKYEKELLDQLVTAYGVYEAIENYEQENGELPPFCSVEFKEWRNWRKAHGLEDE